MADDPKWQSYHGWLLVAGLVYLGITGGLALWNVPDPEIEKIYDRLRGESVKHVDELMHGSDLALTLWVTFIIVVFLLNIYYIYSKENSHIIIVITSAILVVSGIIFTLSAYQHNIYDNKGFPLGGLILFLWAVSIIVVMFSFNYMWRNPDNHFTNATFLVAASFLFALLFSMPQMAINENHLEIENYRDEFRDERSIAACRQRGPVTTFEGDEEVLHTTGKIMEWEHKKAVDEITERTKVDDTWYHNKFLLVGGLFGAFLAYSATAIGRGRNNGSRLAENSTNDIADMFKTVLPTSVLGMACVVSIGIDLHMRSNVIVTHHLGLWITHCVEQVLNVTPDIFTGWESFLRIDGKIDRSFAKGMHRDFLFGMIAPAHFYFTSVYLYILYLGGLFYYFLPNGNCLSYSQNFLDTRVEEQRQRSHFRFIIFIFVLVHVTLALFVIGGNSVPSVLKIQLALWPSRWFSGTTAVVLPLFLCVLVSFLTFMRLFTLYQSQIASIKKASHTLKPKEPSSVSPWGRSSVLSGSQGRRR